MSTNGKHWKITPKIIKGNHYVWDMYVNKGDIEHPVFIRGVELRRLLVRNTDDQPQIMKMEKSGGRERETFIITSLHERMDKGEVREQHQYHKNIWVEKKKMTELLCLLAKLEINLSSEYESPIHNEMDVFFEFRDTRIWRTDQGRKRRNANACVAGLTNGFVRKSPGRAHAVKSIWHVSSCLTPTAASFVYFYNRLVSFSVALSLINVV